MKGKYYVRTFLLRIMMFKYFLEKIRIRPPWKWLFTEILVTMFILNVHTVGSDFLPLRSHLHSWCVSYVYKYVCNCVMHSNMNIIQSDARREHYITTSICKCCITGCTLHQYIFYMDICPCHHFKTRKVRWRDFQCNFTELYIKRESSIHSPNYWKLHLICKNIWRR